MRVAAPASALKRAGKYAQLEDLIARVDELTDPEGPRPVSSNPDGKPLRLSV
jgi:hypothetical protein